MFVICVLMDACVMLYDVVLLVWLVVGCCARVVLVLVLLYLTLIKYGTYRTVFVIVILLKTNFLRLLARLGFRLRVLETGNKIQNPFN